MKQAALPPLLVLALLTGCAPVSVTRPAGHLPERTRPAPAAHGEMPVWRFDELARAPQPIIVLRSPSGAALTFQTQQARLVQMVATRMIVAAGKGETPDWLLVGTPTINAFATYQNGRPLIAVTLGLARLLQHDEGAWAALMGHELAHFRLGHHQAQRSRKGALSLGSSLAGLVLSAAGLGVGSIAADAAETLMERSFSRDDERDADRAGFDYVRHAGFDPHGALRLQTLLLDARRESSPGWLSTHPSGEDRIEAIRQLLRQAGAAARESPDTEVGIEEKGPSDR